MLYSSRLHNLLFEWLKWQFLVVPQFILKAWDNYLKFGLNYFSTPLLLKTLFSPWRRYKWSYPRGFDFWLYFEAIFSNLIFRVIGFIIRSVLIVVGVVFEMFIFIAGLVVFLAWFLLPIFLIWGFYHGLRLLFYV
jgi:hypothetical protein